MDCFSPWCPGLAWFWVARRKIFLKHPKKSNEGAQVKKGLKTPDCRVGERPGLRVYIYIYLLIYHVPRLRRFIWCDTIALQGIFLPVRTDIEHCTFDLCRFFCVLTYTQLPPGCSVPCLKLRCLRTQLEELEQLRLGCSCDPNPFQPCIISSRNQRSRSEYLIEHVYGLHSEFPIHRLWFKH